jgi:hypothetical protein
MDPVRTVHVKTRQAYDLAAQTYYDLFHDELSEKPRDYEIQNERIFAIGRKIRGKGAHHR